VGDPSYVAGGPDVQIITADEGNPIPGGRPPSILDVAELIGDEGGGGFCVEVVDVVVCVEGVTVSFGIVCREENVLSATPPRKRLAKPCTSTPPPKKKKAHLDG